MNELATMKTELASLRMERLALDAKIKPLQDAIIEAEAKFKIGDNVKWKSGQRVSRGRIVQILGTFSSSTKYRIIPTLKNGSDGIPVTACDWSYDHMELDEDTP